MAIDLDGPPPEPVWPDGFTVATMQPGEERLVHATTQDAFLDHWDFRAAHVRGVAAAHEARPDELLLPRPRRGRRGGRGGLIARTSASARAGGRDRRPSPVAPSRSRRGADEALLRRAVRAGPAADRARRRRGEHDRRDASLRTVGMSPAAQDDVYEKCSRPARDTGTRLAAHGRGRCRRIDRAQGGGSRRTTAGRRDPNTCPYCGSHYRDDELRATLRVCPQCGHHFPMRARERIASLADPDTFEEEAADLRSADPLDFFDLRPYRERWPRPSSRPGSVKRS